MPDRTYIPRTPPSPWDRILHHPFEIIMAAWWLICGVILGLSQVWPGLPTSPSIATLPPVLAGALSVLIGGGGAAVLVGLSSRWDRIDRAWLVERIGLSAAGAGWLAYGTAVLAAYPSSLVSWSLGAAMSAAALARFAATILVEHRTRAAITEGAV